MNSYLVYIIIFVALLFLYVYFADYIHGVMGRGEAYGPRPRRSVDLNRS